MTKKRSLKSDFDSSKLAIVDINKIKFNDYNPKKKRSKEWLQVKKSIEINGFRSPIIVCEIKDDEQYAYEIIDGEQRITAAKELGYTDVYVINEGILTPEEKKNLTVWYMAHVEPDFDLLAPLAKELNALDLELPFTGDELSNLLELEISEKEEPTEKPERFFEPFTIQCMKDEIDEIRDKFSLVAKKESLTEGDTLRLLLDNFLSNY